MSLNIEILAVVFSFLSVALAIRKSVLTWSFGIIGIISYAIIFFKLKMPAQTLLQFVFLLQSLYGWHMWNKPKEETKVQSLDNPDLWFLVATLSTTILSLILLTLNWTKYPSLDGISTIFSVFANFLLANKVIQAWIYWSIVNISLIIVFYAESMYASTTLYFVFLIMSIIGYLSWQKDLKTA